MTSRKRNRRITKHAADFPALREFFSAYLHQDFRDEYGSASAAAHAFRKDANNSELAAVRKQWKAWRSSLAGASAETIAQAARKLGAGWRPQGDGDLDDVQMALKDS